MTEQKEKQTAIKTCKKKHPQAIAMGEKKTHIYFCFPKTSLDSPTYLQVTSVPIGIIIPGLTLRSDDV